MNKILRVAFCVCLVFILLLVGRIDCRADNSKAKNNKDELMNLKIIKDEENADNEYVLLNNEFVSVVNDFSEGKITETEYVDKCNAISKKVDSKEKELRIISAEEKYYKLKNGIHNFIDIINNQIKNSLKIIFKIKKKLGLLKDKLVSSSLDDTNKMVGDGLVDDLKALTTQEIRLYATNPLKVTFIRNLTERAREYSKERWQEYALWQGNGDAFRHAFWMGMITKKYGADFANLVGFAHEGLDESLTFDDIIDDDSKMDISNNQVGMDVGYAFQDKSDDELADEILKKCVNGELKRVRITALSKEDSDHECDGVYTKYVGYYRPTTSEGLFINN